VDLIRECLKAQVRYAIDAGIDVVQVRERDLESRALADLTCELIALIPSGATLRVVINDRLDVALAAGAAGVHLRSDSMSPSAVRSMAPPGFLIGCSVHGPSEAAAVGADADYLIAGTVWESGSKPGGHPVLGSDGLAAVVRAARVPVLAIGGVTAERAADVAAAGAAGIAAIGLFIGSDPPKGCRAVQLAGIVRSTRAKFGIT
jgi:thiamine-phosphate pyrophosphorylase